MYHLKGSSADPNRIYASQTAAGLARSSSAPTTEAKHGIRGNQPEDLMSPDGMPKGQSNMFVYEGEVGTHKLVRRHATPMGVQTNLACRAVAHRSKHRLRRRGGRRDFQIGRRRQDLEGIVRAAPGQRPALATGRGWYGRTHNYSRPEESQSYLHRHFCCWRVPNRRRRRKLETDQPRPEIQYELPDPDAEVGHCVHRIACTRRGQTSCSCKNIGT